MNEINLDTVSIEDCIDCYELKHIISILEDGHLVKFEVEGKNE